MNFIINVSGVDGDTWVSAKFKRAIDAIKFLERYDHEGSCVSLQVEDDNPEEVYDMLTRLRTDL